MSMEVMSRKLLPSLWREEQAFETTVVYGIIP
jgi:hypothetical protein